MSRVAVIGHFGIGLNLANGQTIKTKIVTETIEKEINESVYIVDAHGGVKAIAPVVFGCFKALKKCDNVILMLTENGLRVCVPVLSVLNRVFKKSLHYVVIGGWLPAFVKEKITLKEQLKKFDGIYVETSTMKRDLEAQGFSNIIVMPNFKNIKTLREDELVYPLREPYSLCTFSRVMKEKGIEDVVDAVKQINATNGRVIYKLDIYGQIDKNQIQWFKELQHSFPEYIEYKGLIDFNKSVDIIKEYFALVFPTRFFTEGVPGTILDAYASGVPVIASKWESFNDVIEDKKTGIGYEFSDVNSLVSVLANFAKHPEDILSLKNNCIDKSREYSPEEVIKLIELGGVQ